MSDFRTQNPFCRPVCSLSLEVNTAFYSVVRGVVWWCFSVKAIPGNFCFFSSPYLQTAESEFVLTITTEFIKKLWLTNFVSSHHLFWFTSDRFQKLVYPHVNKAASSFVRAKFSDFKYAATLYFLFNSQGNFEHLFTGVLLGNLVAPGQCKELLLIWTARTLFLHEKCWAK